MHEAEEMHRRKAAVAFEWRSSGSSDFGREVVVGKLRLSIAAT
jgi:hypothetical protein